MKSFIILGIGNPGKKYEHTPHNLGKHAIDILASQLNCAEPVPAHDESYSVYETEQHENTIILAKSEEFMNTSGVVAATLVKKHNIPVEQLIVLHDDIDTEIGTLKVKQGGSASGHNGIRDIINALHTDQFTRIRIGAAHQPRNKKNDASEYVLKQMPKEDYERATHVLDEDLWKTIESLPELRQSPE